VSINQLKKCVAVVLPDLIMRAEFQNEILRGYDFFIGNFPFFYWVLHGPVIIVFFCNLWTLCAFTEWSRDLRLQNGAEINNRRRGKRPLATVLTSTALVFYSNMI